MSKGKEKTNGSSQRGNAVAERPTGRSDGEYAARQPERTPAPSSWRPDPMSMMRRFAQELDRAFEGFGIGSDLMAHLPFGFRGGFDASGDELDPEAWAPTVELFRRGDRLVVRADLPGLSRDDIHVELANDMVTIQGERRHEHEDRREDYFHSERSYGSFYRSILLPEGVDSDKAEASFRDGVLEITVPAPQAGESRRRRLEVKG